MFEGHIVLCYGVAFISIRPVDCLSLAFRAVTSRTDGVKMEAVASQQKLSLLHMHGVYSYKTDRACYHDTMSTTFPVLTCFVDIASYNVASLLD